jgi:hypothetical protein
MNLFNFFGTSDLKAENTFLKEEVNRLRSLCEEKDLWFLELAADALRHGSKLAGKHMADRKNFLNGR